MVDLNGDGQIQYFNDGQPLTAANTAVIASRMPPLGKAAAADADKAPLEAALAEATCGDATRCCPKRMLGGQSLAERGLVGNELPP